MFKERFKVCIDDHVEIKMLGQYRKEAQHSCKFILTQKFKMCLNQLSAATENVTKPNRLLQSPSRHGSWCKQTSEENHSSKPT